LKTINLSICFHISTLHFLCLQLYRELQGRIFYNAISKWDHIAPIGRLSDQVHLIWAETVWA